MIQTVFVNTMTSSLIYELIRNTSNSIVGISRFMAQQKGDYIDNIIRELNGIDLEFTVNVIDSLSREITVREHPDSIKKALYGVNEILELIHKELDEMKEIISYHKSKYLCNWRKLDCTSQIDALKRHKTILLSRYSFLMDCIKIYI